MLREAANALPDTPDTVRAALGGLPTSEAVRVTYLFNALEPSFYTDAQRALLDASLSAPNPLAITLGKVVAFAALMLVVGRRVIPWMLERIVMTGSRELFRLGVLATALGVAYGATVLFGVSFALGAFFAGMVLAESPFSQRAAEESLPLRDAFSVLFFVSVSMLFDPSVLVDDTWAVLGTVLIVVVGKSLAAFAVVRAFGHANRTALTISASLAQIGEFSFILIGLGISLEILPVRARGLLLAAAILSILLNPLMFGLIDRLNKRAALAEPARAE